MRQQVQEFFVILVVLALQVKTFRTIYSEIWEDGLFGMLQIVESLPHLLVRRSHEPENLEKLIDLALALDHWMRVPYLKQDATESPNINRCAVDTCAKENFWSAVPQSFYFMSIGFEWKAETPRQSEIGNFYCTQVLTD